MVGRVSSLIAAAIVLLAVWMLPGVPTDPTDPGTRPDSAETHSNALPLAPHRLRPGDSASIQDARGAGLIPPTREEVDGDPWLGASVAGRIVNLDGSPVENVPVTVRLSGYSTWMNDLLPDTGERVAQLSTRTDGNGRFVLGDLPMHVSLSLHLEGGVFHPLADHLEIQGAAWTRFRADDLRPLRIGDLVMLPDPTDDGPQESPSPPIPAKAPARDQGRSLPAPLHGVVGRVVDRHGVGVRLARVRLRVPMDLPGGPRFGFASAAYDIGQGVTDVNGRFRVVSPNVPTGQPLLLNVDAPRHAAAFFDVTPLATDELRDLTLPVDEAARVSVTAFGIDGSPVPDASVVLRNADGLMRCRPTDLDGRASFSNLPPGVLRLSLHSSLELASAWSADRRSWDAPVPLGTRELQLAPGELGEVELRAADAALASLSGVVYLDGQPAGGAWIQLHRCGDWDREPIVLHLSRDGSFRTSVLPAGDLRVQIYAQLMGDTVGLDLLRLKAGEHTTIRYDLRPASLTIRVIDRSGAPVVASVQLGGEINGSAGTLQMTLREDTVNGLATFPRLPPGTWSVEADPRGKDDSANKTASVVLSASQREILTLVVD